MKPDVIELDEFVFDGPASQRGMPDFTGKLTADDVEKIKAFIQGHGGRHASVELRPAATRRRRHRTTPLTHRES